MSVHCSAARDPGTLGAARGLRPQARRVASSRPRTRRCTASSARRSCSLRARRRASRRQDRTVEGDAATYAFPATAAPPRAPVIAGGAKSRRAARSGLADRRAQRLRLERENRRQVRRGRDPPRRRHIGRALAACRGVGRRRWARAPPTQIDRGVRAGPRRLPRLRVDRPTRAPGRCSCGERDPHRPLRCSRTTSRVPAASRVARAAHPAPSDYNFNRLRRRDRRGRLQARRAARAALVGLVARRHSGAALARRIFGSRRARDLSLLPGGRVATLAGFVYYRRDGQALHERIGVLKGSWLELHYDDEEFKRARSSPAGPSSVRAQVAPVASSRRSSWPTSRDTDIACGAAARRRFLLPHTGGPTERRHGAARRPRSPRQARARGPRRGPARDRRRCIAFRPNRSRAARTSGRRRAFARASRRGLTTISTRALLQLVVHGPGRYSSARRRARCCRASSPRRSWTRRRR